MTLTVGDIAALTGMMVTISGVVSVITKYYVKAEIGASISRLRLELKQDRLDVLESQHSAKVDNK